MRNPWLTIHLYKDGYPFINEPDTENIREEIPYIVTEFNIPHKEKTVLHDIVVSYTE